MFVLLLIVRELLGLLESGGWFCFDEVVDSCSFSKYDVWLVLDFLGESGFLEVDDKRNVFRLIPALVELAHRVK